VQPPSAGLKTIVAANASPMTLDGTRTYIIGNERVVIIDPGPALDSHLDAVTSAVGRGAAVTIICTHSHADHAEAADVLAQRLYGAVRAVADGDLVLTDAGALLVLATPGHTSDHVSLWWEAERALFCGDLMMGGLDTALVAHPEGNLALYLASLRKLAALNPAVIYPAHGPAFDDPAAAIADYIAHREARIAQVSAALGTRILSDDELIDRIYGDSLNPELRPYARAAIQAYIDYVRGID
jgi:glyoxylase-like metal-dependent hydrolase (beta-lactamase superfamily II)